jgi:TRAP-type C4-dicarboxylate transport system permease small subunit
MKIARKIAKRIFDVVEIYVGVLAFSIMIFAVVIQVFSRYVLNIPQPGLFELSIYSFIWVIYLGGLLAKRYRKHIRFDILVQKLPPKIQKAIDIFFDLLTNIVLLVILVPSIRYTAWNYNIKASALRIPWTYLLLIYPLFIILLFVHNSVWIYTHLMQLLGKKAPAKEAPPWL